MPKKFCREFVIIKGHALQVSMYMSCVLGIKPLMDDWIPTHAIGDFRKACRKYGLHCREDIIFLDKNKEDIGKEVVGRENITSTSGIGLPLAAKVAGTIHVFVSKDKNLLKEGMWYPAIIKNRVVFQPRADTLNYGAVLGYPDCCIRFFRKYNNWDRYSYLYEVLKNTKTTPSFLCNPFLKDMVFSYIYHMPCGYDCVKTKTLVSRLRKEIKKLEPDFVTLADTYLKMPFLVFYERKVYGFEGSLNRDTIRYKKYHFLFPDKRKNIYAGLFKRSDRVRMDRWHISLFKGNRYSGTIDTQQSGFAPEYPFMIQFS